MARLILALAAELCLSTASALRLTPQQPLRMAASSSGAVQVSMAIARFRTGDSVEVISGDDKGTVAKVLKIDTKKNMCIVEGVNIKTKHVVRTHAAHAVLRPPLRSSSSPRRTSSLDRRLI